MIYIFEGFTQKLNVCALFGKEMMESLCNRFKSIYQVIYTTNAIESLNSPVGSLTAREAYFRAIQLLKTLYLATFEAVKNGFEPMKLFL